MEREVYVAGVYGKKYHVDRLCPQAPRYDRRSFSEHVARSQGCEPCRSCALTRVQCAAHRCIHNAQRSCTKHCWTAQEPQLAPIAGCLSFKRS